MTALKKGRLNTRERHPLGDKTNDINIENEMLTPSAKGRRSSTRLKSQNSNRSECNKPNVTTRRKVAITPSQTNPKRNSSEKKSVEKPNPKVTQSSPKKVTLKRTSFDKRKTINNNDEIQKVGKKSATKTVPCSSGESVNSKRMLRKRKTKNYADLSQDLSNNKSKEISSKEHVPVYLKGLNDHSEKKQKDPFEFTYDSPVGKRNKLKIVKQKRLPLGSKKGTRKPKIDQLRDSDASFHVFTKAVKAVQKKVAKKRPNVFKERFIKPIMVNMTKEQKLDEQKRFVNLRTKQLLDKIIEHSHRESYRKSIDESALNDKEQCFGFNRLNEWESKDITGVFPSTRGITVRRRDLVTKRIDPLTSTPMQNSTTNSGNSTNRVNIISNVLLSPPRDSISWNDFTKLSLPVSFDNTSLQLSNSFGLQSPWRGDDLSVRRNPHFLTMKSTSLPCYNQEMILEPRLLELPATAETPRLEDVSLKQTNILDYFNDHSEVTKSLVKEDLSQTLFDVGEFSPLKSANKPPLNEISKSAQNRRVALNFDSEIMHLSETDNSMSKSNTINEDHDIDNYFGFNDSENKENRRSSCHITYKKKSTARPMRIPAVEIQKAKEVIESKCLEKFVEAEKELEKLPEEVAITNEVQDDNEAPYVGLFEDLQAQTTSTYVRKRRRARIASVEGEADAQKRKRRNLRTKSEEEALNKWAAQFNALCDEIEQHELETA